MMYGFKSTGRSSVRGATVTTVYVPAASIRCGPRTAPKPKSDGDPCALYMFAPESPYSRGPPPPKSDCHHPPLTRHPPPARDLCEDTVYRRGSEKKTLLVTNHPSFSHPACDGKKNVIPESASVVQGRGVAFVLRDCYRSPWDLGLGKRT